MVARIIIAIVGVLVALQLSSANAQTTAVVVASCGTPPISYPAGASRPLTQDTTGALCLNTSSGGVPIVTPTVVCDGTTNNAPAIQAAIAQLEATSPTGGTVNIPICNQIAIASTILVTKSNIFIQGVGGSGPTGDIVNPSSYVGTSFATSVLKWTGATDATTPMVRFEPVYNGGSGIKGGGLSGVVLAGMSSAAIGLELRGVQFATFPDLIVENTTVIGVNLNVATGSLSASSEHHTLRNTFDRLHVQQIDQPETVTASCLAFDGDATNAWDPSSNIISAFSCIHKDGPGIRMAFTDNNVITNAVYGYAQGTGTGNAVEFHGSNDNATAVAFNNVFTKIGVASADQKVVAYGTDTYTFASRGNVIQVLRLQNSNPNNVPVVGRNGSEETPILMWCTQNLVCNYGPPTKDNLIVNGDFLFDQIHAGAAANMTTTGFAYQTDGWKFITGGLSSQMTSQVISTDGPEGASGRSIQIVTTSAASPTAAQFALLCGYVEAADMVQAGMGGSSAKALNLSFWTKSSLTGTFTAFLASTTNFGGSTRLFPFTYTIPTAATWLPFQITVPGDTSGTWGTGTGLGVRVCFDFGSGSNLQATITPAWAAYSNGPFEATGAVQVVANNAATFNLARVRMIFGPAPSPYMPAPFSEQLAKAQRYFACTFPLSVAPAQNAGVTGALTVRNPIAVGDPARQWSFPVPMRPSNPSAGTSPTITTYNPSAANANWRNVTAGADVTATVDAGTSASAREVYLSTGATVATLGDYLMIHACANAGY